MTKHLELRHNYTNENGGLRLFGLSRFNLGLRPPVRQLLRWFNTKNKRAFKSYATPLLRSVVDELRVESDVPLNKLHQLYAQWDKNHDGWKLVKLLKKHNLSFQSKLALPKLLSLKFKVERNGKNPPWQDIKVSMENGWYGLLNGRPRVSISLQGFIKAYFKAEAPDSFLKDACNDICGFVDLEVKIHLFTTGSMNDRRLIERIYSTPARDRNQPDASSCYPSVSGSCMSKPAGDEDAESDSYFTETEGNHPCEAYVTDDIGIAWVEDDQGNTMMRCMLNRVNMTTCRYYGSTAGKRRVAEENHFFNVLKEHGFTRSDIGLADCSLVYIPLDSAMVLLPYLDNTSGLIYDGNSLKCTHKGVYGNISTGNTSGIVERPSVSCHKCLCNLKGIGAAAVKLSAAARPLFTCKSCVDKEKLNGENKELTGCA